MATDSPKKWFETWFDTPLYEKLYANRDMEEAQKLARLIGRHHPPEQVPRVLDVACGSGRHSFNLARMGYSVTGVDLSETAITKAKRQAKDFPYPDRVQFSVHDMRQPIDGQFPLVVNLFTSFGYMPTDEDNLTTLHHMLDAVTPGGGFVMDFLNRGSVIEGLTPSEELELEDYTVQISRYIKDNAVHKEMRFKHASSGQEQLFTERVKLYDLDWFREALQQHGFELTHTYGDYEGTAYNKTHSPRLIMIASKST